MATIRIGTSIYQASVKQVHSAPDWPDAAIRGDMGGYVDVGNGKVAWVQSSDGEQWTPIQQHENMLRTFLETIQGESQQE